MRLKRTLAYVLLQAWVIPILLLTGCQSATGTSPPIPKSLLSTQTAAPVMQTPSVDLSIEIQATHPWKIAFIPKEKYYVKTGNLGAYWQPAWDAVKQAGQDLGVDVDLAALNVFCETDAECVEPQIRLIAGLIERGDIDGMIVAPLDSNRLSPVVDKAIAAGIPVIAMDTPVDSDRLLTFVVFDNFTAGKVLGQWVVEQLGGKGKALILAGPSDQQNALDRHDGFLAGLQSGSIDVLGSRSADWEIAPAYQITADWLRKFPQVDVILAANDDMALGAAQAVNEAGRWDILITGFDATEVGLAAIIAGRMSATIDQSPGKQARLAVQLLLRHLETGETFPPIILMPDISLVTQENVQNYQP
ncbi:MAG: sugar ABC transporter substrate-binding protein [Anaerolineae bacterium]|nr:sugar ABC transporter substrate-binding protein [Anaerolineae bacterium]